MIKDFRKTENLKKIKNGQFSFFDILQLPYTVISNSEKLTHPNVHYLLLPTDLHTYIVPCVGACAHPQGELRLHLPPLQQGLRGVPRHQETYQSLPLTEKVPPPPAGISTPERYSSDLELFVLDLVPTRLKEQIN